MELEITERSFLLAVQDHCCFLCWCGLGAALIMRVFISLLNSIDGYEMGNRAYRSFLVTLCWPQSFEGSRFSATRNSLIRQSGTCGSVLDSLAQVSDLAPRALRFLAYFVLRARELATHAWYGYPSIDTCQSSRYPCSPGMLTLLAQHSIRHASIDTDSKQSGQNG